jgi:hypothetical protein
MRPSANKRSVGWAIAVGALVLGAAGSATAQGNGAAAGGAAGADGQVSFQHKQQLSPQDELAQADAILSRMDQASGTVRRQLERARTARDVVKSLCLNDKLSQIDVASRSARDRQTALQAAVARNDGELSNHEFTIMTVLKQRAEQLAAEANQCLGEEVAFVGQTQVTPSYPEGLPSPEETNSYPGGEVMPIGGPPVGQGGPPGGPIAPPMHVSGMM